MSYRTILYLLTMLCLTVGGAKDDGGEKMSFWTIMFLVVVVGEFVGNTLAAIISVLMERDRNG